MKRKNKEKASQSQGKEEAYPLLSLVLSNSDHQLHDTNVEAKNCRVYYW